MKIFIVYFAVIALASCNSNSRTIAKNSDTLNAGVKATDTRRVNEKSCYQYYSVKDTVKLEVVKNENSISGTLRIKHFGKDENIGTFTGVMKQDTLVADYTFMSEGVTSVRQIAFFKRNNTLVEGYGDVEEKNGKMVFRNLDKLNFKDSAPLVLGLCGE